jgi:hypothetical protein
VQVPHCSWQSKALDEAPYKLSGAVAKLASITFLILAFSYWIDNLGFVTEGKLAAIFIKPSLGVSNWPIIYIINYTPTSSLLLFNTAPSGTLGVGIMNSTTFSLLANSTPEVDGNQISFGTVDFNLIHKTLLQYSRAWIKR